MRKWILAIVLLAAFFTLSVAGEGDRRYDNFYARKVVGAQQSVVPPWGSCWRYMLITSSASSADSVVVGFTYTDGDTAIFRLPQAALTSGSIVFYGPPITIARIKAFGTANATILMWK